MASSVNRRIETDLSRAMGQCDLAGLIRPRSTEPIRACGLRPRQQAEHMTASDLQLQTRENSLRAGGHPHMARGEHLFGRHAAVHQPDAARLAVLSLDALEKRPQR